MIDERVIRAHQSSGGEAKAARVLDYSKSAPAGAVQRAAHLGLRGPHVERMDGKSVAGQEMFDWQRSQTCRRLECSYVVDGVGGKPGSASYGDDGVAAEQGVGIVVPEGDTVISVARGVDHRPC